MSKKRKAENEVTDPLVDYDVHKMHEFFPFFEQCSVTSAKGKQPVIEIILGYSDLLLREYLILHQHEIEEMKKPLLSLDWIKGFATSDQQHLVTRMYQRIETYFNFLHAIGTFNMEANPERFSRPTWSLKHDIDELYTSKKFDLTQQTDLEMMRLVTQRLTANFIDWQSGKSIYGLPPNQNHAVSRDVIDTLLASLEITHITGQSGGRMSIGYEKVTLVFKTGSCGSQNEGKVFTFVVNKNSIYNGLIMLDANDRVHTLWGDRDYIMINPEIKKAMLRDFFDSFKIPEGTARVCCLVLFFRSSLANSSWKQLRFHQSKGNPEFDLQLHFGPLVSMDVT